MEAVLGRIFREPKRAIRYPVLHRYLQILPVEQLDKAFKQCIALESSYSPDDSQSPHSPTLSNEMIQSCYPQPQRTLRTAHGKVNPSTLVSRGYAHSNTLTS